MTQPPAPAARPEGKIPRSLAGWTVLAILVALGAIGSGAFPLLGWVFGAPIDGAGLAAVWGIASLLTIAVVVAGLAVAHRVRRRRPWVRWPAVLVSVAVVAIWVVAWIPLAGLGTIRS